MRHTLHFTRYFWNSNLYVDALTLSAQLTGCGVSCTIVFADLMVMCSDDVKVCEKCGANSDLTEVNDIFMTRVYVAEALLTRGNNALASTLRQLYNRPYPCPTVKPKPKPTAAAAKPATVSGSSSGGAAAANLSSPPPPKPHTAVVVNTTLMSTGLSSTPPAAISLSTQPVVECKGVSRISRCLIKAPSVLALTLVWNGDPDRDTINAMLSKLSGNFNLGDAYLADDHSKPKLDYKLRGMITFYGAHYTAFFRSDELDIWLLFNDSYVRRVGDWSQVLDRCSKGLLRPTVLFYENAYDFKSAGVLSPHALAKQMAASKKLDLEYRPPAPSATATGHERKSSLPVTLTTTTKVSDTKSVTAHHRPSPSAPPVLPILSPPTAPPSQPPPRPSSPGVDEETVAAGFAKRRDSIPDVSAIATNHHTSTTGSGGAGATGSGGGSGSGSGSGGGDANTTALPWRCLRCQREWTAAVYDLPCGMCDSVSHILDQPQSNSASPTPPHAGRITPPATVAPPPPTATHNQWLCRSCGRSWQNSLAICVMCDRDAPSTTATHAHSHSS